MCVNPNIGYFHQSDFFFAPVTTMRVVVCFRLAPSQPIGYARVPCTRSTTTICEWRGSNGGHSDGERLSAPHGKLCLVFFLCFLLFCAPLLCARSSSGWVATQADELFFTSGMWASYILLMHHMHPNIIQSTGLPKGVLSTHRAFCWSLLRILLGYGQARA